MMRPRSRDAASSGIYGVVGREIGYSLSPFIFGRVFDSLKWSAVYGMFDLAPRELGPFLKSCASAQIRGLNVTKPYKSTVLRYCDRINPIVHVIGAANTVAIRNGKLLGYNTDVSGVLTSLRKHKTRLKFKDAVVFGAGGAARAVAYALLVEVGMRSVTIAARSRSKARRMIHGMQDRLPDTLVASAAFKPASDLLESLAHAALVVNATPVGGPDLPGHSPLPLGADLQRTCIAFDLVYRPRATPFLRAARAAGCRIVMDGWTMLVAQADAAFQIWTGRQFPAHVRGALLRLGHLP